MSGGEVVGGTLIPSDPLTQARFWLGHCQLVLDRCAAKAVELRERLRCTDVYTASHAADTTALWEVVQICSVYRARAITWHMILDLELSRDTERTPTASQPTSEQQQHQPLPDVAQPPSTSSSLVSSPSSSPPPTSSPSLWSSSSSSSGGPQELGSARPSGTGKHSWNYQSPPPSAFLHLWLFAITWYGGTVRGYCAPTWGAQRN